MTLKIFKPVVLGAAVALLLAGTGCEQLPGSDGQQGAAIGGLSGAAVGAAVGGSENRLLGALLGGALGAGGGYLIGANVDKISGKDSDSARKASEQAQKSPVTASQARNATTADINNDGFVTMDELVAMENAGLGDEEIIQRLRMSDQVFELTAEQQNYLRRQGVSQRVVSELPNINTDARERLSRQDSVIGRPAAESMGGSTIPDTDYDDEF